MCKSIVLRTLSGTLYASMFRIHWCAMQQHEIEAVRPHLFRDLTTEKNVISHALGDRLDSGAGPSSSRELCMKLRDPFILPRYDDHSELRQGLSENDCALEVIESNDLMMYHDRSDQHRQVDKKIKKYIGKLKKYSSWAESLATRELSKELRSRSCFSWSPWVRGVWAKSFHNEKGINIEETSPSQIKGKQTEVDEQKGGLGYKTSESNRLNEEVSKNRKRALIEGLKDCLYSICFQDNQERKYPLPWQVRYDKAVFQVMNYLYKFRVITPKEMGEIFSTEAMLRRTGEHIARLFPGVDVELGPPNHFFPESNYLTMAWQTRHLHHCLGDLEQSIRREIIHIAFAESCRRSQGSDWWKDISPNSKGIVAHIMQDDFLQIIDKWTQKGAISAGEITLDQDIPFESQIHDLRVKVKHAVQELKDFSYSSNKEDYLFNLVLLEHLFFNLSADQFLLRDSLEEKTYVEIYNRLQIITASQILLSWHQRYISLQVEPAYEKREKLPEIQVKKMRYYIENLMNGYKNLKEEYEMTHPSPVPLIEYLYEMVAFIFPGEFKKTKQMHWKNLVGENEDEEIDLSHMNI